MKSYILYQAFHSIYNYEQLFIDSVWCVVGVGCQAIIQDKQLRAYLCACPRANATQHRREWLRLHSQLGQPGGGEETSGEKVEKEREKERRKKGDKNGVVICIVTCIFEMHGPKVLLLDSEISGYSRCSSQTRRWTFFISPNVI